MENTDDDLTRLLSSLSGEDYCYLTTKGRVSGRPHEIEIWFGMHTNTLYLLSGGGEESDWVKNLLKEPTVTVRITEHTFAGTARVVHAPQEDTMARYMVAEKYQEWNEGKTLSDWARTALAVAIDIHNEEEFTFCSKSISPVTRSHGGRHLNHLNAAHRILCRQQ